ncbi:zinc transporter permease subunit ZevB [Pasteurella canis]|uniref:zinc transporter permease subunit ZevB n=1 Tax=Pasteurella canis TaxID=753 RepID=UPI001CBB6F44|nr:zinc transporter permease subunit ZevB [Pasteurella canis]UAX42670.1 zinc transporter permease subunit ZevB [Pasteurella canis]
MRINFPIKYSIILLLLGVTAYFLFPYLFFKIAIWQRDFNQLMSSYLHQINEDKGYAGGWLIIISFFYGVFHALGPGHGKFIIATYLSTHQTQLKASMKLTLLSSLMQGVVAVAATSIIVVLLNLSSQYFKLTQLWLERTAFFLLFLLGLSWCYQYGKNYYLSYVKSRRKQQPQILSVKTPSLNVIKVGQQLVSSHHDHHQSCGCGHQHLPNQTQLAVAMDWKSQFLVICSIGMRPCSGAIFILFLAYMLDLYLWGVIATFAMAIGTGLTLSCFALIVLYARHSALRISKWYQFSSSLPHNSESLIKLLAGVLLVFFATSLLYGTTLSTTGGAALFMR